MCFSAPVSFAASAGLGLLGGAAFGEAKKNPGSRQMLIAAVPLLFALQQAFEGVQWLAVRSGSANVFAAYGYLFFAFLFWPAYVPGTVYALDPASRAFSRWFIAMGIAVSLSLLFVLAAWPISISIDAKGIAYGVGAPVLPPLTALYILAVCGPLFASSIRSFRRMGVLIFVSAAVAALFFEASFISLWCFFAAVISAFAYVYLRKSVPRTTRR